MALLDLQDMDFPQGSSGGGGKSGASKGCGNDHSSYSLLIC